MSNANRGATAAQVRALLDDGPAGALADGELLGRFAGGKGAPAEAAFAALVERHGPMVLRACRSILRDPHRAEDAFQATFLLLARRAGTLWVRDSIAPWLHSVACRVASGARAAEARRLALERRAWAHAPRPPDAPIRDDLASALHEEIERLPDRLKGPLVLCYLEGLTHDRAAEHLSCPVGTVRSRLARARDRLRRGLTRRGLAPPEVESTPLPIASLPPSLAILAIRAARMAPDRATAGPLARWSISLSEGVHAAMTIHPLKSATALLIASAVAIAAGRGGGPIRGQDGEVARPREAGPQAADRRPEPSEARLEALAAESRSLRLRVEDLERRLDVPEPGRKPTPAGGDPRAIRKVRPRSVDTFVDKVLVAEGQAVRKGDPLVEVRSNEVAASKNDLRVKFVQWNYDRIFLQAREPLAKDGRITQMVWADTRNEERKSRLAYFVARDKLVALGLAVDAIEKLLEGLDGAPAGKGLGADDLADLAKLTITSPVAGTVVSVEAEVDGIYGPKDVLMLIAPPKP